MPPVRALLHQPGTVVASSRTWDEFTGATSGYRYIEARGEIALFWRAVGIHAELPTVFYCGTGGRASLAFFYAWLMGWER